MTAIAIIQQSCADSLTIANLTDGVYGRDRQHEHIELIASENYASPAVMEAQGSA